MLVLLVALVCRDVVYVLEQILAQICAQGSESILCNNCYHTTHCTINLIYPFLSFSVGQLFRYNNIIHV